MAATQGNSSAVRFVADPPRIPRGTSASLYWTSDGMDECDVYGPDGAPLARANEGTVLTPVLVAETTFSIQCFSAGAPVEAKVKVNIE